MLIIIHIFASLVGNCTAWVGYPVDLYFPLMILELFNLEMLQQTHVDCCFQCLRRYKKKKKYFLVRPKTLFISTCVWAVEALHGAHILVLLSKCDPFIVICIYVCKNSLSTSEYWCLEVHYPFLHYVVSKSVCALQYGAVCSRVSAQNCKALHAFSALIAVPTSHPWKYMVLWTNMAALRSNQCHYTHICSSKKKKVR